MRKIAYTQLLTDEDRLKIQCVTQRGKVVHFVVQYYALIESRWRTVMRVDNYHDYPHQHTYHLHAKEYHVILNKDNNIAFNEAKQHVIKDFEKIKENYLFSK